MLFGNRIKEEDIRGKSEAKVKKTRAKGKLEKQVNAVQARAVKRKRVKGRTIGQATKGIRWMPWRWEPMKDAVSCEKPRGAANRPRSGDIRMGKPTAGNAAVCASEHIGCARERGELKHLMYPQEKRQ